MEEWKVRFVKEYKELKERLVKLSNELLQRALANTFYMLKNNIEVIKL